jgi:hypothetical protein
MHASFCVHHDLFYMEFNIASAYFLNKFFSVFILFLQTQSAQATIANPEKNQAN